MDHAEVGVKWHTEGRGEESRAMLDLSVGRLDAVRGWLRVDDFQNAGHFSSTLSTRALSPFGEHESAKEGHTVEVSAIRAMNEPWSDMCRCQLQGDSDQLPRDT